jgi:hypothetical protein
MKHIKLFEEFANNDIIVNEGAIAVLGSNMRTDIEKWLGTHAELRDWMSGFVKTSDAKKDYIKWLKSKNEIESKAQTDAAAAKQLADMGFDTINFKGRPMVWSGKCASTRMYFLNTRFFKWVYDPGYYMDMTEWKPIPAQVNDRVAHIVTACSMKVST